MACPEVWLKLRPIIKILFVSTIIAFCSTVIGFATPVWISGRVDIILYKPGGNSTKAIANYLGIWQACGGDINGCMKNWKDLSVNLIATRAFACLGLIGAVITTTLVFIYSCLLHRESDRVLTGSIVSSFVTGVLLAISLLLFDGEFGNYYFSISFAMMCISSILYVVNGVLCLVCLCSGTDDPPYVPQHS